jgi:hypothetical protein
MAWKRPQKIGKWAKASAISARLGAIERSISIEQQGSGKKSFQHRPFVLTIPLV